MKRTPFLIASSVLIAVLFAGCGILEPSNGTIAIQNNTEAADSMAITDIKVGDRLEEHLAISAGQSYTVSVSPGDYEVRVFAGSSWRWIDVSVKSDATVNLSFERNAAVSQDFHLVQQ